VPREERRTTITTSDLLTNPQYWRDRAKEIRVFAQRSTHPETKRMLQNIVADSEHLAQRAEERLQESRREKRRRVLACVLGAALSRRTPTCPNGSRASTRRSVRGP
jgi:hypothetical protein